MRRKIYDRLLRWKNEAKGDSVLMIEGARRVGKSYIVEEFARNEYSHHVIIDLNNTTNQIKSLFTVYLNDLDSFFQY